MKLSQLTRYETMSAHSIVSLCYEAILIQAVFDQEVDEPSARVRVATHDSCLGRYVHHNYHS